MNGIIDYYKESHYFGAYIIITHLIMIILLLYLKKLLYFIHTKIVNTIFT